jgi:hypothetical protein
MTRFPLRPLATVAVALAVLGAACARTPGSGGGASGGPSGVASPPPGIAHLTGPNDLVLRVEQVGGFVPPSVTLVRLPAVSLFGDGRLITEGAQTEIYPQPALPPLLVQQLSETGVQRILELARDAGLLGKDASYVQGGVADAPTTVFTVNADGGHHVVQATALGLDRGPGSGGVSQGELAALRALERFQGQLAVPGAVLPAGSVGDSHPYDPEALRLFVTRGTPSSDPGLDEPAVAWPLSTPLAEFGTVVPDAGLGPVRCGTVDGADLDGLMPSVRRATQISPWTSDGDTFGIAFRPLLPDESGCPS